MPIKASCTALWAGVSACTDHPNASRMRGRPTASPAKAVPVPSLLSAGVFIKWLPPQMSKLGEPVRREALPSSRPCVPPPTAPPHGQNRTPCRRSRLSSIRLPSAIQRKQAQGSQLRGPWARNGGVRKCAGGPVSAVLAPPSRRHRRCDAIVSLPQTRLAALHATADRWLARVTGRVWRPWATAPLPAPFPPEFVDVVSHPISVEQVCARECQPACGWEGLQRGFGPTFFDVEFCNNEVGMVRACVCVCVLLPQAG